jgi:SAM-dependent methyltransferase
MKDNFSTQSDKYLKFRPSYPSELYSLMLSLVPDTKNAWDCGTGNGQVARELARYFDNVFATDISEQQIANALPNDKIAYSVQKAEKISFPDNTFSLITVAQAIHWFDFNEFYKEVNRTIVHNGIIAVFGYGLIQVFAEADDIIAHFYQHIVGPFWDSERRYIDQRYQTIPFPFIELDNMKIEHKLEWTFEHLIGYLETWSAVKHYKKEKNQNPIDLICHDLEKSWGRKRTRTVKFPILLRIGRVEKASVS